MTQAAGADAPLAERLAAVVHFAGAGIVVSDRSGPLRLVNRRFCEMVGRSEEELLTLSYRELTHPDDRQATEDALKRCLEEGGEVTVEKRYVRPDGSQIWVRNAVTPLPAPDGEVDYVMAVVTDITREREAHLALEASERRNRALLEATPAMVVIADAQGRASFTNSTWEGFTGLRADNGRRWAESGYVHPDDMDRARAEWERARKQGVGYDIDYRVRRKDGAYRWVAWQIRPVHAETGEVVAWTSAAIDIDDRVRLREELERTNDQLRLLGDASHAVAGTVDYGSAIEALAAVVVPAFADWCAVDTLEGDTIVREVAVHSPAVDEAVAAVLRTTPPAVADARDPLTGVIRDGEPLFLAEMPADMNVFRRSDAQMAAVRAMRPNSLIATPLRARGHVVGALSVARVAGRSSFTDQDYGTVLLLAHRFGSLLDRARLFAEVTRALSHLRLLADAGLVLSAATDVEDAVQKAVDLLVPGYADWCTVDLVDGDAIRRQTIVFGDGVDAEAAQVVGQMHPRMGDEGDGIARIIATGEPVLSQQRGGEMRPLRGGTAEYVEAVRRLRPASAVGVPLRAGDGIFGALGLVRVEGRAPFDDIDLQFALELGRQLGGWIERSRLFSELRQALSAKDEFFGFVSHELKTPLTTVTGISDVLTRRYDELDESQRVESIGLIRRDALRLEEIIANMLTLAQSERTTGDEPSLVQRIVAATLNVHRQRNPERRIDVRVPPGLSPVLAPSGWIDRVLENLLSNAEKYSEPETAIEVECAERDGMIEVRVLDRGRGVTEEQMRDVFEPFFRANPTEQGVSGVGLGLTVCRRLVERLGGEIWIAPREGGGTEAGVRLPIMVIPED